MTESQEVEAPRKLRWINAWVIVLLSVACMWLLFTRGEAVAGFKGSSQHVLTGARVAVR